MVIEDCRRCDGRGSVGEVRCGSCDGTGERPPTPEEAAAAEKFALGVLGRLREH